MLPQSERLKLKSDFQTLYSEGQVFTSAILKLLVVKTTAPQALAGFVVSKKISKKAPVRNRIKRQMRAAYAALRGQIGAGYMVLFIARSHILSANYQDIAHRLETLLEKAGLHVQGNFDSVD